MKELLISRKTGFTVVLAVLFVGLLGIAQATVSVVQQLDWGAEAVQITADGQDGNGPDLLNAPNGDLMIVYSQWNLGAVQFSNPYFSLSTDGGTTWSAPAPILGTPNNTSQVFVEGTYDLDSVPHVVWIDFTPGNPFPTSRVFYARRVGGNWTAPETISSRNNTPIPSKHAEIVASAAQTLDVVWDEDDKLYHRRSTDGGATWQAQTAVPNVNAVTNEFKIATDGNGAVFAAWEQTSPGSEGGSDIFFSKYDGASWSSPVRLSVTEAEDNRAAFPTIAVSGANVYVAYSYRTDLTAIDAPQFVVTKQCGLASDCSDINNWSPPLNLSAKMFVNAEDPYFIVPDMAYDGSAPSVHAYYHGIPADAQGDPVGNNEAIFGRDSCQEWNVIDEATSLSERSGNPSLVARDRNLHLTYEQVTGGIETGSYRIMYNQAGFTADCTVEEPTPTPSATATVGPVPTRGPNDIMLPTIFK